MTIFGPLHLARRLRWSLQRGSRPLAPADERWLVEALGPGLAPWFLAMDGVDRHHALDGARHVDAHLRPDDPRRTAVIAAAALHDVGKLPADLGTVGRVVATIAVRCLPGRVLQPQREVESWTPGTDPLRGLRARWATYRDHAAIGAEQLARAHAPALAVAWAAEHHGDPAGWTIDRGLGALLAAADEPAHSTVG